MAAMRARMRKELEMLERDPPSGVSAWPKDDKIDHLEAQILGPEGSPYEKGVFHLDIEVPERYPFEPPKVKFLTPIYHPNIDNAGRICLDTLKMQPKGSWLPSVNISTLLTTIRLLMAEPNADDGLMPDITDLFKHNRDLFNRKANDLTREHAQGTQLTHNATITVSSAPGTMTSENKEPTVQEESDDDNSSSSDSSSSESEAVPSSDEDSDQEDNLDHNVVIDSSDYEAKRDIKRMKYNY